MSTDSDRRETGREVCQTNRLIRATLSAPHRGDPEPLYLYLVDLSTGGLRVNSEKPFPEQVSIRLQFGLEGLPSDLEPPTAFDNDVRVVWQKPLLGGTWVCGLALVEPSEATGRVVSSLLRGFSPEGQRSRFRLRQSIEVALRADEDSPWLNALAMDLSPVGLRVRIYQPLTKETTLQAMILLSDSSPRLHGPVRVAWAGPIQANRYEAGLILEDWSEEQRAVIGDYMDLQSGLVR